MDLEKLNFSLMAFDMCEPYLRELVTETYLGHHILNVLNRHYVTEKMTTEQFDTFVYLLLNEPEIDVFELDSFSDVFDDVDIRLFETELHFICQEDVLVYYLTKPNLTDEEKYLLEMCYASHNNDLDVIMDLEYAEEKAKDYLAYAFLNGLNEYARENMLNGIVSAIQEKNLENYIFVE